MSGADGSPASLPTPPDAATDDLSTSTEISVWIMVGVSGALVALRLYCKWLRRRGLWWDDYILIVAWVMLLSDTICVTISTAHYGLGRHIYTVPLEYFPQLSLLGNFAATFALLGVMASKTSFAVTILRLTTEWTRALVWFIIIAINTLTSVSVIMTWIPCDPRRASTVCVPVPVYVNYSIFAGAFSGATDLGLALLPWYLIWDMNINIREKLGIGVAMSLGVCACATAILKCVALPTIARGDYTYDIIKLVVWGNAEVATTIMAASIPVLRGLLRHSSSRPYPAPSTLIGPSDSQSSCRCKVLYLMAWKKTRSAFESGQATRESTQGGNSTTMSRRASEDPVISRRDRESGARGAEGQAASSEGWREESVKIGGKDGEATVTMSERRENDSDGYEMDDIRHMV